MCPLRSKGIVVWGQPTAFGVTLGPEGISRWVLHSCQRPVTWGTAAQALLNGKQPACQTILCMFMLGLSTRSDQFLLQVNAMVDAQTHN